MRDWTPAGIGLVGVLVCVFAGAWAAPASAVKNCKVKIEKHDGTLLVSARSIDGTLSWGYVDDNVTGRFANEGACLSRHHADACELGAVGDARRNSLPPDCVLYLADASKKSCAVGFKSCSPGMRPVCPPDMERIGAWCVETQVNSDSELGDAILACDARQRSLCPMGVLQTCDAIRDNGPALSCGDLTDLPDEATTWTLGTNAEHDELITSRQQCYRSDGTMFECDAVAGPQLGFFCCTPLGGQ